MGYISMDAWSDFQTDNDGNISIASRGKHKGKPVPISSIRVRVSEGENNTELFTLDKWRKVVMSRGNEFQVNSAFTSKLDGKYIPARTVKLSSNGSGDELRVKTGDGEWTTYHIQSGLVETFASVCEQTLLADENWKNLHPYKKEKEKK
tara:strand:+ start:48 stop:494 length:447 start_codon:yes stop_codon:yes gene_type:complete